MTTIWLVRHGETQSNRDRIFQGQLDTELTERGIEQASRTGQALAGHTFDAVYASDLRRASETARLVAGPDQQITLDPRLREMHYGVLQGVPIASFREVLTEHGVADGWGDGPFSLSGAAPPGGESIDQMRERLALFLADVDAAHPPDSNDSVMIVTHGGALRLLVTVLLDLPQSARTAFTFRNCSVSRFQRSEHQTAVDALNVILWNESPVEFFSSSW